MHSSIKQDNQQGRFGAPLKENKMKTYKTIVAFAPIVAFMVFGFITILVDRGYLGETVWYLWAWFSICLCIQTIIVLGLFNKKGEF